MVCAGIIAASLAEAAELRVGPGRDYASVQAAIDAASPGDRIVVDAGSYGPITVGLDLEIVGLGGPAATTIGAGGAEQAIAVLPDAAVVLRGLAVDGAHQARGLDIGSGADVVVEDGELRDGAADWGGCARIASGSLTLRRTAVSGCVAESGGGVYGADSVLVLEASAVSGCVATSGFGGGVGVDGSSVAGRGCRFDGNLADDLAGDPHDRGLGGAIFTGSSSLELRGCAFAGNAARSGDPEAGRGGAIRLWQTAAEIDGCAFDANAAHAYGSAIAAASSELALSASAATGNTVDVSEPDPSYGGTLFCDALSDCAVTRSWFEGNVAGDGGAICALGDLTVTTSMFCANVAASDGGAIDLGNQEPAAVALIAGNVLAANVAGGDGGALVVTDGPRAITNNDVVGNAAGAAAIATVVGAGEPGLELIGNLIAENATGDAPALALAAVPFAEGYDWLYGNAPSAADVPLGTGTTDGVDPGLTGPVASCDPSDLRPAPDSPLIDASDPSDAFADADGSRGDIGAFGGPWGDALALVDADGDGWSAAADCADADAAVHPDADERCNGLDDDCDGLIDADELALDAAWLHLDADGDGYGGDADAAWRCPGPGWAAAIDDCDDADAAVGASVTWYADADGDGLGDPTTGQSGCEPPAGAVLVGGDCDDDDPAVGADGCEPPAQGAGDRDGDGVADAADPAPDDAGGAYAGPPAPALGCGCSAAGGPLPAPGLLALALALALSRRRR